MQALAILEKEYASRTTALNFRSPFQLLVSTILSAQSTDTQVNKITRNLYQQYPDARSFLTLSESELQEKIRSIGLFRNKAKNILATARKIVEEYGGEVPQTREELIKLPGVGRKTANVILSVGFNQDAIAVDTHVFRVANRIGLAEAPNVEKTEEQLMRNIPRNKWSNAHHWLIWHGRLICKAGTPRCSACPLQDYCKFFRNNKNT
ncbi:MAG: endonuclease III [Calditrichia bacterium]